MDPLLDQRLESINLVLTLIFALEMVLKLTADGYNEYVADAFNIFDGVCAPRGSNPCDRQLRDAWLLCARAALTRTLFEHRGACTDRPLSSSHFSISR